MFLYNIKNIIIYTWIFFLDNTESGIWAYIIMRLVVPEEI